MNRRQLFSAASSVTAGLVFTLVILVICAHSHFAAAGDFFAGTFTSVYYAGAVLNTAALLAAAALGDAVVLSSGELNLGGEGQIYAGGFTAAAVFAATDALPPALSLVISFAAAVSVPALMALISAVLRQFKHASVLLTSFLVSAAAIPFIDSLIAGRFRGSGGNLLATPFIRGQVRFTHIMNPSPLSVPADLVPLLCIAGWYFMNRTVRGRQIKTQGISPEFARYCGYPQTRIMYGSLAVSGALHGLSGFLAVAGTYYTCHSGFYSGMGWNALSCALIAGSDPLALIPSGLILSWIFTAAGRTALNNNFGFDIGSLIQGVMLFCIAFQYAGGKRNGTHDL